MNCRITGLLLLLLLRSSAQNLGSAHQFLLLSPSAGVSALGGISTGLLHNDPSLQYVNPGSLNPAMHHHWSLSMNLLPAGLSQGDLHGAYSPDSIYTLGTGIHYMRFGEFQATDEAGNITGSFSGGEYAINLTAARSWKQLHYGLGLKGIYSHIENYSAGALAADAGIVYANEDLSFQAGLVVRNMGLQIKSYIKNESEPLPLEINLGISQKLAHLPLRYFIVFHDLQSWNIIDDYSAIASTNIFGETPKKKNPFFTDLLAHFNLGAELYLGKVLKIRAGYNHELRQELRSELVRGLTGFSFGSGLDFKRLGISYARNVVHQAGAYNHISLWTSFHAKKKSTSTPPL